jgi:hypothetical protein
MLNLFRIPLTIGLSVIICGCAGYAPSPDLVGQQSSALTQVLGQPERESIVDGKKRLHFPRGPAGSHTYFVYLDDEDRVLGWEQVLTEERFAQVAPGMTKEQVIELIGISKITHGLGRQRGFVWHYRYFNHQCKSFVIEFTLQNIVRSAGYITRSARRCNYVGAG